MYLLSILYKPGIILEAGVESRHGNMPSGLEIVFFREPDNEQTHEALWDSGTSVKKGLSSKRFRVPCKRAQEV